MHYIEIEKKPRFNDIVWKYEILLRKGLSIAHIGPIIINSKAKLGDFCRIHVGVNIGTNAGTIDEVP